MIIDRIDFGHGLTFDDIDFLNFSNSFPVIVSVGFAGRAWVNLGLNFGPAGLQPSKFGLRLILGPAFFGAPFGMIGRNFVDRGAAFGVCGGAFLAGFGALLGAGFWAGFLAVFWADFVGLFSGPECFLADLLVRRYVGIHRASI